MNTGRESSAQQAAERLREWFSARLPDEWFEGPPEVVVDREEITVIGRLAGSAADRGAAAAAGADAEAAAEAESGADAEAAASALRRARRFREKTRDARIEIAREVEHMFGRKVSWGIACEGEKVMFTTLSVPVMTRLRQPERRVLDTLVDAGVARSRSDALAWCVRLVEEHEDAWLAELRDALRRVEQVRAAGPQA